MPRAIPGITKARLFGIKSTTIDKKTSGLLLDTCVRQAGVCQVDTKFDQKFFAFTLDDAGLERHSEEQRWVILNRL